MNKKKLVIGLLVFVMVLSLALTALVGCTPKDDPNKPQPEPTPEPPAGYKTMSTSLSKALSDAVYKTVDEHKVNSLAASASLKVTAKYGESTSEYVITFGANVALKPDDTTPNQFGLSIVDAKANNANILNAYYYETTVAADASKENYKTGAGALYVDLGSGADQQKFAINGLSIKSVLKSEGVNVTDEQAADINGTVGDGIDSALGGIMSTIFGLGEYYQKNDNSEVLFSLSLAKVFESAGDLLDGLSIIDDYTGKLGLDLKSTDIKTLLPAITLDLHIKMTGAGNDEFEDAVIAGVDAEIGVASKDLTIKRTDGTNFVRINIDKDVALGLDLGFKFGGTATIPAIIGGDYNAYKTINAVNFTVGGELTLNEPIQISFKLGSDPTSIGIPKGTYKIELGVDVDPVQLLGKSFNTKNLSDVLDLVNVLVSNAVKTFSLKVTNVDPTQTASIDIAIKNGLVTLTDASLLGELASKIPAISGLSIKDVLELPIIKNLLPKDEEPSSGEASGNTDVSGNDASGSQTVAPSGNDKVDIDALMDVLAGIVKNLTIGVNDGSDILKVIFENYLIKANEITKEDGTKVNVDTTVTASIIGNKTSGLTVKADVKGIVIGQNTNDISAEIKVNGDGITVTAKSTDAFKFGDKENPIELAIDLVFKLNSFKIGNASDAK